MMPIHLLAAACLAGIVSGNPEAAPVAGHIASALLARGGPAAALPRPSTPGSVKPAHIAGDHGKNATGALAPAGVAPFDRPDASEGASVTYVGSVRVYVWSEGTAYRLVTAPGEVSDIALQPGESLVSVAAGDTARWIIGDTSSGSGEGRRAHILVKPVASGLATNLVIATDRRVYHVEASSIARPAMTGIAWSYPEDALLALKRDAPGRAEAPAVASVTVDALNFAYRIEGDSPLWRPLRAFDDGRQTFIEFPPGLGQREAPPLFARGESGRAELVNYRVRGHYYVVDRLFADAELRLGEKRQQVVRIVREGRGS